MVDDPRARTLLYTLVIKAKARARARFCSRISDTTWLMYSTCEEKTRNSEFFPPIYFALHQSSRRRRLDGTKTIYLCFKRLKKRFFFYLCTYIYIHAYTSYHDSDFLQKKEPIVSVINGFWCVHCSRQNGVS